MGFASSKSAVLKSLLRVLTCAVFLVSCTGKQPKKEDLKTIRILTWTDYLHSEVIRDFETQSGFKVVLDFFSSNEELAAKVKATLDSKSEGYDLILPSDYMVSSLIQLDALLSLDHSQLAFLKDFESAFKSPDYDRGLKYSVPFAIGVTGIAVNLKKIKDPKVLEGKISWKEILETKELAAQTIFLDDVREAFHVALLVTGKNWETATAEDLKIAGDLLKKYKKNLKAFTPEARPAIESGECGICMAYSGDVRQIKNEGQVDVMFVVPQEGGTIWTDNFSIPKNARNIDGAYAFLNSVLSSKGAGQFTERTTYPTANQAAPVKAEYKIDVGLRKRLHFIPEKAELLPVLDRLWTEFKSL
jgi:spermidine/putrescine transport system substrate-binding protein